MDGVAAEERTLSQREIDALLSSLATGVPQAKRPKDDNLKRYDFRSPARFSKEQMRTLKLVFEDFSGSSAHCYRCSCDATSRRGSSTSSRAPAARSWGCWTPSAPAW